MEDDAGFDPEQGKMDFCDDHFLNWDFHCWFCHYLKHCCSKCPLTDCRSAHSLYNYVNQFGDINAAEAIALALEARSIKASKRIADNARAQLQEAYGG